MLQKVCFGPMHISLQVSKKTKGQEMGTGTNRFQKAAKWAIRDGLRINVILILLMWRSNDFFDQPILIEIECKIFNNYLCLLYKQISYWMLFFSPIFKSLGNGSSHDRPMDKESPLSYKSVYDIPSALTYFLTITSNTTICMHKKIEYW